MERIIVEEERSESGSFDFQLVVLRFVRNAVWALLALALAFVLGVFILCAQT